MHQEWASDLLFLVVFLFSHLFFPISCANDLQQTQHILTHANQQNGLVTLAAKSFYRRKGNSGEHSSKNDAVASLVSMKQRGREKAKTKGEEKHTEHTAEEGWRTRRRGR